MHLWAWVKTTLGLSVLVENTFAPYHGHNVCDAVAAQESNQNLHDGQRQAP